MTVPGGPAGALRLSVVLTIVDGGEALARCLAALAAQADPPPLEVLVPHDATVPGVAALAARFPQARFLSLGSLPTEGDPLAPRGQHELFDRRRAAGLAAATGDLVAILEDRGVPDPDWARTMHDLHAALPHAVIGGAVENAVAALANHAVHACDFTRYQRPFAAGPAAWVTDVNVAYKRRALEATRALWQARYHEPVVHDALVAAGEVLWLSPAPVVRQHRGALRLGALLRERWAWGRLYGWMRAREAGAATRARFLLQAPLVPPLVFVRHLRRHAATRAQLARFLRAAPLVALLLATWAAGEAVGSATRRS